jgi:DNA-binding GntR family transcriptional regulator
MNSSNDPEFPMLRPIDHQSLKSAAVAEIQAAILRGELKPGMRVTELGLAGQLGVGQATIREALIELEHQGYIQRGFPRKTFVTMLTRLDVEEIYRLRTCLETLVIDLLTRGRRKKLEECEVTWRQMTAAAQNGQVVPFIQADLEFHRALWRANGNQTLVEILERLVPKIFAFGIMQRVGRADQNLLQAAEDHGRLLRSIEQGRLQAAKAMMEESMRQAQSEDLNDLEVAGEPP